MPPRLTRAQRRAQDWCQKDKLDNMLFPVPRDTGNKADGRPVTMLLGQSLEEESSQDSQDSDADDGSEDSV
jgi:hypothetical protein